MPQPPDATDVTDVAKTDAETIEALGLRREVGWLRRVEQRRTFGIRLHVGRPGSMHSVCSEPVAQTSGTTWPLPSWVDAGARRDVCEQVVARWVADQPCPTHPPTTSCWLTRPGHPRLHDEDPAWLSAARWALGAHGVELRRFVVVTRYGWWEPATGECRQWKRLRLVRSS